MRKVILNKTLHAIQLANLSTKECMNPRNILITLLHYCTFSAMFCFKFKQIFSFFIQILFALMSGCCVLSSNTSSTRYSIFSTIEMKQ